MNENKKEIREFALGGHKSHYLHVMGVFDQWLYYNWIDSDVASDKEQREYHDCWQKVYDAVSKMDDLIQDRYEQLSDREKLKAIDDIDNGEDYEFSDCYL